MRRWLDVVAIEHGGMCKDEMIVETLQGWIDQDRKHTALKALQGMIWEAGYRRRRLHRAHLSRRGAALRRWHDAGLPLAVYSSGSVPAQKLFFGNSDAGDLTPLFSRLVRYRDRRQARRRQLPADRRRTRHRTPATSCSCPTWSRNSTPRAMAGMQTVLVDRREDYPQPREGAAAHGHHRVNSFADILLSD